MRYIYFVLLIAVFAVSGCNGQKITTQEVEANILASNKIFEGEFTPNSSIETFKIEIRDIKAIFDKDLMLINAQGQLKVESNGATIDAPVDFSIKGKLGVDFSKNEIKFHDISVQDVIIHKLHKIMLSDYQNALHKSLSAIAKEKFELTTVLNFAEALKDAERDSVKMEKEDRNNKTPIVAIKINYDNNAIYVNFEDMRN